MCLDAGLNLVTQISENSIIANLWQCPKLKKHIASMECIHSIYLLSDFIFNSFFQTCLNSAYIIFFSVFLADITKKRSEVKAQLVSAVPCQV